MTEGKTKAIDDKDKQSKQESQQKVTRLKILDEPDHEYDIERLNAFRDLVFGDTVPENAHELYYATSNSAYGPGMPFAEGFDRIERLATRTKKGKALYFNIASTYPDVEGTLRHKRSLFAALHVLVLDDIGTKIKLEDLPDDFEPTYIIESSEGNFQYGYVFEEPITDLNHATALMQTISLAGLTDKGGVMATKIVRLPDGINGKDDPVKRDFKVKLIKDDGPYWTPKALLDRVNFELEGIKVTWDGIVNGEALPFDKKHRTEYMPLRPTAQSADGVIDPVLEWLYKNDLVVGDSGGDWVDIECPWATHHSDGNVIAGYKPVGRGEGKQRLMRGFHCFHDHCADNNTKEFIEYILYNSDLRAVPIFDIGGDLFNSYVFDSVNNRVWRVGTGTSLAQNIDGFKTEFNQPVTAYVIGKNGQIEARQMSAAQLWLWSLYRTVVSGGVHAPGDEAIVKDQYDTLWVNTYRPVQWGVGDYDMEHVHKFKNFIEYLLPEETEREYFMDWLAAKAQDPKFRGTGIVMVAEAFGVGRSTLGNMMSQLFGVHNCASISFDTLINPQAYNYWEDKDLVVISEAKETSAINESRGAHRAYESLKQRIDTTVQEGMLNLKFQPHKRVQVCCSYLILTNHVNAIAVPESDRRLNVFRNPDRPAPISFFVELHRWIDETDDHGNPIWAKHVYRWLREYKIADPAKLLLPLHTEGKASMVEQSLYGPAKVMHELNKYCTDHGVCFATSGQLMEIIKAVLYGMGDPRAEEYKQDYLRNCMNDETIGFQNWKLRREGSGPERMRVFKHAIKTNQVPDYDLSRGKYVPNSKVPRAMRDKAEKDIKLLSDQKDVLIKTLLERLQEGV